MPHQRLTSTVSRGLVVIFNIHTMAATLKLMMMTTMVNQSSTGEQQHPHTTPTKRTTPGCRRRSLCGTFTSLRRWSCPTRRRRPTPVPVAVPLDRILRPIPLEGEEEAAAAVQRTGPGNLPPLTAFDGAPAMDFCLSPAVVVVALVCASHI